MGKVALKNGKIVKAEEPEVKTEVVPPQQPQGVPLQQPPQGMPQGISPEPSQTLRQPPQQEQPIPPMERAPTQQEFMQYQQEEELMKQKEMYRQQMEQQQAKQMEQMMMVERQRQMSAVPPTMPQTNQGYVPQQVQEEIVSVELVLVNRAPITLQLPSTELENFSETIANAMNNNSAVRIGQSIINGRHIVSIE